MQTIDQLEAKFKTNYQPTEVDYADIFALLRKASEPSLINTSPFPNDIGWTSVPLPTGWNGYFRYKRKNGVVTINSQFQPNSPTTPSQLIAALPEGFLVDTYAKRITAFSYDGTLVNATNPEKANISILPGGRVHLTSIDDVTKKYEFDIEYVASEESLIS